MTDYLGRDDLLALDLTDEEADAVLSLSGITGHGGEPCVEAARLDELLELARLELEEDDLS
jgi:hypothetical protein